MAHRGNPNWGKFVVPRRAMPSEFELEARRLRLTPKTYVTSPELRAWCERNKNRCYIPESLLQLWDITVDADLAPTRSERSK
jgi:hypothetical protein